MSVVPLVILALGLCLAACSSEPTGEQVGASRATAPPGLRLIDPPAGTGAMAPNLAMSHDGILLTWLQPARDGRGHELYASELRGEHWTAASLITTGEGFFANWADLPAAAEAVDGTRFAHWLRKLGKGTYAYGAALSRSGDGGASWEELGLLHDDASPTEHGFVSYVPLPEGGVRAFWLDGRAMPTGAGMQLRTTLLNGTAPRPSETLDARVCECCATDAALTTAGPLVVYRDRDPSEIRDITVMRATSEGWSEPVVIHDDGWQIHGCPVNGPAVTAEGDRVAVAWFTAAGGQAKVKVAFSDDAGASFGTPILVDEAMPIGRVDITFDPAGHALVSWMGTPNGGAEIRWRRISAAGASGQVHVVAATSSQRSAGVPRMMRRGDQLLIAWVEDTEPTRLHTGLVSLP